MDKAQAACETRCVVAQPSTATAGTRCQGVLGGEGGQVSKLHSVRPCPTKKPSVHPIPGSNEGCSDQKITLATTWGVFQIFFNSKQVN